MVDRNTSSDAGRRGAASSQTKQTHGYQYTWVGVKGEWLPAYGGGMGQSAETLDPDIGSPEEEVGCSDGGTY